MRVVLLMTKGTWMSETGKQLALEKSAMQMSTMAATFTMNLIELGASGFSRWLTTSFLKPKPQHKPGWFHYDEEMLLHEAFRSIGKELPSEAVEIAREGVKTTLTELGNRQIGYIGLLEILGIAELFAPAAAAPALAKYLLAELHPTQAIKNRIETQSDLIALREILETQYRQFMSDIERGDVSGYRDLSKWAYDFLANYQNRSDLAPAYAPMYVLALYSVAKGDIGQGVNRQAARKYIERILKNSIRTQSAPYPALYGFASRRYPVGLFPYNIEPLLDIGAEVYRKLDVEIDKVEQSTPRRPLVFNHNPFDLPLSSATGGTLPSLIEEEASQTLDDLHAELEMA